MGLSDLLARVAATCAHVLVVEAPGAFGARVALERELDRVGWCAAASIADADVLAVVGEPGPELCAVVDHAWAQISEPRVRLAVGAGIHDLKRTKAWSMETFAVCAMAPLACSITILLLRARCSCSLTMVLSREARSCRMPMVATSAKPWESAESRNCGHAFPSAAMSWMETAVPVRKQSTHGPTPASNWRISTSWLFSHVEAMTCRSPAGSINSSPAAAASRTAIDSSTRVWSRSTTSYSATKVFAILTKTSLTRCARLRIAMV